MVRPGAGRTRLGLHERQEGGGGEEKRHERMEREKNTEGESCTAEIVRGREGAGVKKKGSD